MAAYGEIRFLMLEQLASADLTVSAVARRIGVLRNSALKSMEKARSDGVVHVVGYEPVGAVYRIGAGVDVPRPVPVDVVPVDEVSVDRAIAPAVPREYAGVKYFELDLLPGVKHFTCDRYRATLSTDACADRFSRGNAKSPEADKYAACKSCRVGACHSGAVEPSGSSLYGKTICGRCHRGATRLIGKHLCISCKNREYEYLKGRNAKGTFPSAMAPLVRRSITYRTAGVVKTRMLSESLDNDELIVATLRDESSAVEFAYRNTATHTQFGGDKFDRSIDAPGDISVTPEHATENAAVAPAPVSDDVIVGIDAELLRAGFDPYSAMREAVEQLERDAPVIAPGVSRRAAKKLRQQQRRQQRVSNLTVSMLRGVGALPAPAPVVSPLRNKLYSPLLFAV